MIFKYAILLSLLITSENAPYHQRLSSYKQLDELNKRYDYREFIEQYSKKKTRNRFGGYEDTYEKIRICNKLITTYNSLEGFALFPRVEFMLFDNECYKEYCTEQVIFRMNNDGYIQQYDPFGNPYLERLFFPKEDETMRDEVRKYLQMRIDNGMKREDIQRLIIIGLLKEAIADGPLSFKNRPETPEPETNDDGVQ